jgi:hypothetical protein
MANQLFVIQPYWYSGTWVFDDKARGLDHEPFVNGADTFLTHLSQHIPNADDGFKLIFSPAAFPGYQVKVTRVREEMGGNWYRGDNPPMEGWLCPALFRYFDEAPAELYLKAEAL